jgi:hypothetical protein
LCAVFTLSSVLHAPTSASCLICLT